MKNRRIRTAVLAALAGFLLPAAAAAAQDAPLPPPADPPGNRSTPEKVSLGKMLFFDRRFSGDGTMSCASCHDPENGYGDGLAISLSYPTTKNWRNASTVINAAYRKRLFWDGRAGSLEEQALHPLASPFEMNRNVDHLVETLVLVPEYVEGFRKAFGDGEITPERIAMAIAAFERTIVSRNAPLDRHLAGDPGALTPSQKRGYDLFRGKAGCAACHPGARLTDDGFHVLGVPENGAWAADPRTAATRRFVGKIRGVPGHRTLAEDTGRYLVTKDPKDRKSFATPSLRDVARTAPYMHNGAFATLEEVIAFYDGGGGSGGGTSPLVKPLGLSAAEKSDLQSFLADALTGDLAPVRPPRVP